MIFCIALLVFIYFFGLKPVKKKNILSKDFSIEVKYYIECAKIEIPVQGIIAKCQYWTGLFLHEKRNKLIMIEIEARHCRFCDRQCLSSGA